jgi:hypothetical protein
MSKISAGAVLRQTFSVARTVRSLMTVGSLRDVVAV